MRTDRGGEDGRDRCRDQGGAAEPPANPVRPDGLLSAAAGPPPFEPHPWLRGGHAQTIAGRYWPLPRPRLASRTFDVLLPDGDRLVLLESRPARWTFERPTAVLVHGLAGCADAPYVVRLGARLLALGARVVRVNLRNSGAGFGRARGIYHAGRSDDLRVVLEALRTEGRLDDGLESQSDRGAGAGPFALVGFSLGANLVLKLAAEIAQGTNTRVQFDCVLAANPPIDLAACTRRMGARENRIYDRNFVKWLCRMVGRLHRRFPELGPTGLDGAKTVYEFDDRYTAPRNGFASADDYYERCSLTAMLDKIAAPGLIVHARDDPFVPAEPLERAARPAGLEIEILPCGGHLGFLSRRAWGGDRRWLDARLAAWLLDRWGGPGRKALKPIL